MHMGDKGVTQLQRPKQSKPKSEVGYVGCNLVLADGGGCWLLEQK
jgi:hypothetical protein